MAQIPANSYLTTKIWSSAVTLLTENQCVAPALYSKGNTGIFCVEDRQDIEDVGGRGSNVTFYFGDRRRGQDIGPRALGSTGFGQSAPQRPVWTANLNMQAQELATTGFFALEIGQTYGNVPLKKKELRDCGGESAEILSRSLYYHAAGITAYNTAVWNPVWTVPPCGNLVTELDDAHRFFMGSHNTDAQVAADANSILTMESLEEAITLLQSRAHVNSPFVPAETRWGEWFIFICDAEGAQQLNRHSSTNRITQLTLAEIQGGNDIDKVASAMRANQGFAGTRQILVLIDEYTPFGMTGSTSGATTAGTQIGNVRRGMLLGREALKIIWGQGFDADSNHIRATQHVVHQQQDWKFFTHWGAKRYFPEDHPTPQSMGAATVSYYVSAATPIY